MDIQSLITQLRVSYGSAVSLEPGPCWQGGSSNVDMQGPVITVDNNVWMEVDCHLAC